MALILAINPGSTSTKIGVFDEETLLLQQVLRHSREDLAAYPVVTAQRRFRSTLVRASLLEYGIPLSNLAAVVARGGLMRPVSGGVYRVNDAMCRDLDPGYQGVHASNLGALIAAELTAEAGTGALALVVDPVAVDEFEPLARYSGLPELPRRSLCHALNMKAVARRHAAAAGRRYEDFDLIVCHLGGGFSVAAHRRGRIVDSTNAYEDGAFSPERAGSLPARGLVELATGMGHPAVEDLLGRMLGQGGLLAYTGTNDVQVLERRMATGDSGAAEVFAAMIYQIAKDIGAMAAVLGFRVDAVLLTGGLAHSRLLTDELEAQVGRLAPVAVYPGEDELLALAEGAARVLSGMEVAKEYPDSRLSSQE